MQTPTYKPDLRERASLDIVDSLTRWHVSISERDGLAREAVFQGWRPARPLQGRTTGELYELRWIATEIRGSTVAHSCWVWTSDGDGRLTAALPSDSEHVRGAFLKRALEATAFETDPCEADSRARFGVVAGIAVPTVPTRQAEVVCTR